jgi:pimeloyl-ACP methyl ester carboxylesterase
MKNVQPNADYDHLTMVGHSMGADVALYFAKLYPEKIARVVTLDNLRVPFMTDGKFKILSFRSKDPVFKTDPGVVPDGRICAKAGITIVRTSFQHTEMSDRGPEDVKESIENTVDKFLADNDNTPEPEPANPPKATEAGPVALNAPVKN